jgi:uncharacterized FlaG/YvyC family protein
MDNSRLENELNELVKAISKEKLPKRKQAIINPSDLAKQTKANQVKLEKSIKSLQESLDYLRICIKYQIFDLEATRRENEYLRKLLEDNID